MSELMHADGVMSDISFLRARYTSHTDTLERFEQQINNRTRQSPSSVLLDLLYYETVLFYFFYVVLLYLILLAS